MSRTAASPLVGAAVGAGKGAWLDSPAATSALRVPFTPVLAGAASSKAHPQNHLCSPLRLLKPSARGLCQIKSENACFSFRKQPIQMYPRASCLLFLDFVCFHLCSYRIEARAWFYVQASALLIYGFGVTADGILVVQLNDRHGRYERRGRRGGGGEGNLAVVVEAAVSGCP